MNFTEEETSMIAGYKRSSRTATIANLKFNRQYVEIRELAEILDRCVRKLSVMSDAEYEGYAFEPADDIYRQVV